MAAMSNGQNTRMRMDPIPVVRSTRGQDFRGITSGYPGKAIPLVAFPLLREEQLNTTRFRFSFEMMETADLLMNAVSVRVLAYLVPNTAFDRFSGMDELNRSYMKENIADGATVTPYFETLAFAKATNEILVHLGLHAKEGDLINTAYIEAYNEIFNYRARNRSPDLTTRAKLDVTLAKAFWNHQTWANVVPDFDQAVIDGQVPLNVVNGQLPVTGLVSSSTTGAAATGTNTHFDAAGPVPSGSWLHVTGDGIPNKSIGMRYPSAAVPGAANLPMVFAELAENGITVSLSNIEVARKTQAFAALRKLYTGHTDDYIIDMLMNGLTVPEQQWREPMLLQDVSTVFGQSKRFSSSADDLTAAVANGATFLDVGIRTPRCPMGGVVMLIAEIMPEQLFERQQDPYLFTSDQETLPEFLRDTLDPEKVEVVQNKYVDTQHATPTGTFGYAPLNHKWLRRGPMIGGKFYRPDTDGPVDEVRQRFWAVETLNPTLSEDFYLCTAMNTKPFVVTNQPPFEVVTRGLGTISGNTVFGPTLIEASDDYDTVMAEVPQDRIDKP